MILIVRRSMSHLSYQKPPTFSRTGGSRPYQISHYSRTGLSVSKGAFSYTNSRSGHNGNSSIAKEQRFGRQTNSGLQTDYSKASRQSNRNVTPQYPYSGDRTQSPEKTTLRTRQDKTPSSMLKSQPLYPKINPEPSRTTLQGKITEQPPKLPQREEKSWNNRQQVKEVEMSDSSKAKTVTASHRMAGLNNIGNTCFMNATLQCLLNLPGFNEYFLARKHQSELNGNGRVAQAYARLVQAIQNGSSRSETPSELKSAIASKKSRFLGTAQQDSQEFLAAILELLSLDLNRSRKPKYRQLTADLSKQTLKQISEEWWGYNKQREDSIVCDYFTGQLLSRVICRHCSHESIAFDNTWDFALNFSRNDGGDVSNMLANFLKEEVISSDYYCGKCKKLRECRRKLDFYRLPRVMVLQIKRFSFGKWTKHKLNNHIKAPQRLDLGPLLEHREHSSTNNPLYRLVGVVNHSGDINYGHYTADCQNPATHRWYHCNDSHVSETSMGSNLDSSSPYLLFYSRQE